MRIGFVQYNVAFGDQRRNQEEIVSLLGDERFDLLVVPELCLSGYYMPSREHACKLATSFGEGETFDFFHSLADKHQGAIVFGFPEQAGNKLYNSAAAVLPDGSQYLYRKAHLFNLEKSWFDPGDTGFAVFAFRGARIGMMICFDWFFPEAARTLMLKGADIICHPANLVFDYCQQAMPTRALENAVFTITSNRTGADRVGNEIISFTGRSRICDTRGTILAAAGIDTDELHVVDINPNLARNKLFTPNNDILADRREDLYF
ncbi:MAG: beta-ureidopropionase [candidate division Zixibacteria bacterium]|nr:beta-ureidopropionase [candidate division Zixibacteria bacterium]